MAATHLEYWDYDRDATVSCPACGWSGRAGDHEELYEQLLDVTCPRCRRMLLIVAFPTPQETRDAAARGNARAIAGLPNLGQVEARWARAKEHALTDPEDLPELPGADVVIEWDFETRGGEHWTVLKHSGQEIWRELAYYEGWERFVEVFAMLKARYGTRLREVRPTPESSTYLYGDAIRSLAIVEDLNAGLRE